MRVDDLDYDLPADAIAQEPAPEREDARLLVLRRESPTIEHASIRQLGRFLRTGDLLVLNDTRVLPARLWARRTSGGRAEILLLEAAGDGGWAALVRAGGALRAGEELSLTGGDRVRLEERLEAGAWRVKGVEAGLGELMDRHGLMPLPPYIRREAGDRRAALDRERYQTLHARHDGAIAAPTAGLHLTPALLANLSARGVGVAHLTLHVGLGTFEPVRTERLEDHVMHEERFAIPPSVAQRIRQTHEDRGRVVAVGTTVVRALEAAAAEPTGTPSPDGMRRTRLLIQPGHAFRAVDAILTNFHLPRSTLLALVAAFAGRERVLAAYREAVARGYRFYSYGDAMLLL